MDNMLSGSKRLALYGLGTETERFISEHGDELDIVCLLDGYRQEGEIYGYPIMPVDRAIELGVKSIIVIARPGSCKVIAKRIRDICVENGVILFDVRGKDLLAENRVIYDFREIDGATAGTRGELLAAIDDAEVVSFDLFDTLVMRKVFSYTDLFEIMERRLLGDLGRIAMPECTESGAYLENLAARRLSAEKELSKDGAPRLETIYKAVLSMGDCNKSGDEFASTGTLAQKLACDEWELDSSQIVPRDGMKDVLEYSVSHGKRVFITTDCYYSKEQILGLLDKFGLTGFEDILVSCEYGVSKTNGLFDVLKDKTGKNAKILHVGDDELADIEKAGEYGVEGLRILSGRDLYYALGGLGIEDHVKSLEDRIKQGLFVSRIFSDPFVAEKNHGKMAIEVAYDIGFLLAAPMISDFVFWMIKESRKAGAEQLLLCARDGYLLEKLLDELRDSFAGSPAGSETLPDYCYFLTSRVAALRAGIRTEADIEYVDSMKYFGDPAKELMVRFGVSEDEANHIGRSKAILRRSEVLRKNYRRYAEKVGVSGGKLALFDFVAKGTSQMFLEKVLSSSGMQGLYFLQLEPEFMKDKGLRIKPFYEEVEKDSSMIFDHYYILETILTSPDPGLQEFDENGDPVHAQETRSKEDIQCVLRMQQGVTDYFRDLISLLPGLNDYDWSNKPLNEVFLSMIGKLQILDKSFMSLKVEDPFFGRMTDMQDLF